MSHNTFQGSLNATGQRFGIVVSRFNDFLTTRLLDGALDCLERHGVEQSSIAVAYVPGALEIPPVAARMASSGKYDAVICLGAVIRGDTPHFDFVAAESAKGIARVGFDSQVPVVYGVITTDNLEQAIERAGSKSGNKGWDAAQTGIEMVNLYREMV